MIPIAIPTALRGFTGQQAQVLVSGQTVGEALSDLTRQFPALERHLRNDKGELRSFVNVYLNEDDVRHLQKEATGVRAGDTLTIVPSIAGGAA